jgi:hypothetical protein
MTNVQVKEMRRQAVMHDLAELLRKHQMTFRLMQNGDLCVMLDGGAYSMPSGSYQKVDGSTP